MSGDEEGDPLLGSLDIGRQPISVPQQLSVVFAVACIVDQFGVTPVITLPRTVILCGWIGFPLAISVFALSIYTAMLLGRCWVIAESVDHTMASKTRYPYTVLVNLAWGKTAGSVINVFLNLAVFTSNIPALVIASQNLQFLDSRLSGSSYTISYCYWIIILGAGSCPLTWLGSPKDMKWISMCSASAVVVCSVMTWTCMLTDENTSLKYQDIPEANWQSFAIAYGNLAFQLACHPAILAIQADMKDKRHLSLSVLISFFVTGGLFIITALLAVTRYGAGVKPNITDGLPNNMALYVDIGLITLPLFLSTIVGGCALFNDLEEKLGISGELSWQRCVLRTGIVMSAVFLAEILPRFDLVMGLLGGIFTGPTTFIMPPLLYYKLRSMLPQSELTSQPKQFGLGDTKAAVKRFFEKHFFSLEVNLSDGSLNKGEVATSLVIVMLGFVATFLAIYYSLRGAVWTAQFVPPCLFDVQAASLVVS